MLQFREIELEDARKILDWRLSPRIASQMITEISDDIHAQKQWIVNSYSKPDFYHWIIQTDNIDIGYCSFAEYDSANKITECGFYIGEVEHSVLAIPALAMLYNFLFTALAVNEIHISVFEGNRVSRLHEASGYTRIPSQDERIVKHGEEINLLKYVLTKEAFLNRSRTIVIPKAPVPLEKWNGCPWRDRK